MRRSLIAVGLVGGLAAGCTGAATHDPAVTDDTDGVDLPAVVHAWEVVPGDHMPVEVEPMDANNNLDVAMHDGRLYLAFRTAPSHFASDAVKMIVVSSTDETDWRFEGEFALGTDVREPQLFSWNGTLFLYFAVLGANPAAFEPQGSRYTTYNGPGDWEPLTEYADATFIPWRIKVASDSAGQPELQMVGYTGGGDIYEPDGDAELDVYLLRSDNGVDWEPFPGSSDPDGVVQTGGGSETDYVIRDDGSLIAVTRNEAGDATGFGSKICSAPAGDLADWNCVSDPRKYDSPLMFERAGGIWLVARRNVTEDGFFDLGMTDLDPQAQYLTYQGSYWIAPKRCALWSVDPDALTVTWVLDLPSKGDTCFPEAVEKDGQWLVYNYTSDPEGPDVSWVEGQNAPTYIYRQILEF